jgi:hypothetical protein
MINVIIDCQTQETFEVPVSEEEKEFRAKEHQEFVKRQEAEAQAKTEAEAKKQALLDRLGITAEEARLLLS